MEYLLFLSIGIAGNVIGTLVGGGGLITLPTMMLMGVPVHSAIGANKVSNMVSAFSSFYTIYRRKELAWSEMRSVLLVSLIGGTLGGLFASLMDSQTLTLIAIILLGFALIMSFIGGADFGEREQFIMNRKNGPILLGVGFYDGMFGPGSSTLALYTYAHEKLSYIKAVGLSRVGVFAMCSGAAITYIATGKIEWPLTLILMIGSTIGAQIGIVLARKVNAKQVKLLLRIVTIVLILQLVYDFMKQL
ncbi:sulfite exporter TauE/SafE family protein [Lysinibacillus pakistanensis]|uniref:Probable membrane transporter protein n=1 Tax=Lysinibacillus pakistanensis TaxID=759811 RepID=A0AAX3X333_9BACI|nr:sulfite exporter TauE/SafE family protein [Lysinibacillus pakistanensis]MDM5233206.1 sulfite exporter TauE/SafE family protein [Lysinibacillus pakistanensis]QGG51313.1 TSUP family transporter [Lysinibacillus pakistanensis]WHY48685.1 sulfite exporter TauE/SafE family protein [Lysinibacillus pakistanensis]WHY53698.1 sulfite exporter TauE/SafE family protein [Lysinibacillus pakistanensis]